MLGFRRQNGQGLQVEGRDVGPGLSFSRNACSHILPVSVAPAHWDCLGGFGLRYAESPQERFGFTRSSLGLKNFAFLANSQRMLALLIQGLYLEKPASRAALSNTGAPSYRWLFKLIKIK